MLKKLKKLFCKSYAQKRDEALTLERVYKNLEKRHKRTRGKIKNRKK